MSKLKTQDWYIYILKCSDLTLYTGVTTDVKRRVAEHNEGTLGAKYTKARRPVFLMYSEKATSRSEAQKREAQVKKLSRKQKVALVNKV